jgi:EmrB/QacA subfamily drug resistance transporter
VPGQHIDDRRTFLVACLGGALSALDSAVNVAFPEITEAFGIDVSSLQWVVVSYVLTYAALLLPFGRLADRLGHRRVLTAGLLLSAVALAGCGVANAFPLFLATRALQGVGIALVLAAAPALVSLSVPEAGRPWALGRFQLAVAVGFATGPALGGVLVEVSSWRAVFLARVPVALAILALGWSAGRRASAPAPVEAPGPDLAGAITFAAGLSGLLFVASRGAALGWASPGTLGTALVAVAVLAAFVAVERRAASPLVELGLFRNPTFAVANVLNATANASMFAIWLLGPTLLVTVRGQGTIPAGALLGVTAAGTAVAAPLAGRFTARLGVGALSSVGLAVEAAGLALCSTLSATTPTVVVLVAFALVGFGLGLFQVPNLSYVMGSLPPAQQGTAAGMSQMVRTAGIVAGVALANALFVARRDHHAGEAGDADSAASFTAAFGDVLVVAAALCAAAAALSLVRAAADRAGARPALARRAP